MILRRCLFTNAVNAVKTDFAEYGGLNLLDYRKMMQMQTVMLSHNSKRSIFASLSFALHARYQTDIVINFRNSKENAVDLTFVSDEEIADGNDELSPTFPRRKRKRSMNGKEAENPRAKKAKLIVNVDSHTRTNGGVYKCHESLKFQIHYDLFSICFFFIVSQGLKTVPANLRSNKNLHFLSSFHVSFIVPFRFINIKRKRNHLYIDGAESNHNDSDTESKPLRKQTITQHSLQLQGLFIQIYKPIRSYYGVIWSFGRTN